MNVPVFALLVTSLVAAVAENVELSRTGWPCSWASSVKRRGAQSVA